MRGRITRISAPRVSNTSGSGQMYCFMSKMSRMETGKDRCVPLKNISTYGGHATIMDRTARRRRQPVVRDEAEDIEHGLNRHL